jgi:YD repeat-containing protein
MKYNRGAALWVSLALLALAFCQGALATTYYTYDILGRVTQVVESDGTTTQYSYDANGNITSINRIAGTSVLSIGSVSASSGATGSSVTITGSGFSSIPSQDIVTFNGVAATVTYASGNRLVVAVPAGASTGDISITTQTSSVTSGSAFTVVPVSITSFSPSSGVAGTVLTVNGGGFDPTPANNTVLINGIPATVSSATATQLQVTVPAGATPGHVSVNAPLGAAVSTGDFFVPAPGYTLGQISQVATLVPGGTGQVYPINPPSSVAVFLFDGTAGQRMGVAITNLDTFGQYAVYAPDGSTFSSNVGLDDNTSVALPPLTQTGTYAWYFTPTSTPTSVTLTLVTDIVGLLPTDGTPTSTSLVPGQNATYTFNGTAGQTYSLTLMPLTEPPGGAVFPYIYNPDGSGLVNCPFFLYPYNNTNYCDFTVGTTGTYTVRLIPTYTFGAYSFGTYVVQDFSAALTAGTPGPTVGETLVPEQHGLLNFTATANQTFAVYVSNVSVSPGSDLANVAVSGPSGFYQQQHWLGQNQGTNFTFNLQSLPAGNYLVTTIPNYNGATISMQAALANGATGTVTTGGTPTLVQTYVPGQNAYFTFNGTTGQNLTLVLSQLALTPTSVNSASVSVNNPDGSFYTSGTCYTSSSPGCSLGLGSLPQTGTYTVTVNPDGQAMMGVAVSAPPDVTGTLTLNNPTAVNLTSLGQEAELTFVATANEAVVLAVSSITTTPANTSVIFYVYNSSGALVTQTSLTADGTLNIGTLVAGTYSVVVVPNNAAMGSMSVELEPPQTIAVPTDGSSTNIATSSPGENAYVTFQANAGDSINVAINNLTLSPGSPNYVNWTVTAPDGTMVMNAGSCSINSPNNCSRGMATMPQTGTYTVNVLPQGLQTMSFTAVVVENITGTITPGTTETLNLSELGQEARLAFTVTSGQILAVSVTGISTVPSSNVITYIGIYTASGSYVTSAQTSSGAVLNLTNLAAGNYFLWIGPETAATSTMQLFFQSGVTAVLPVDGSSNNISTSAPGENAYLQFSATTGDSVNIAFTNLVLSPSSPDGMSWNVTAPDGSTVIGSSICSTTNPNGCRGGFVIVSQTGTYTVNIAPQGLQTMSFMATVADDLTTTITPGTVEALNLNQIGENARFAFTLTSSQSLSINLTGITNVPSSGVTMYMSVNTTSGTSVSYVAGVESSSGSESLNVNLGPGNYILWIGPEQPATTTAQLSFQ